MIFEICLKKTMKFEKENKTLYKYTGFISSADIEKCFAIAYSQENAEVGQKFNATIENASIKDTEDGKYFRIKLKDKIK